MTSEEKAQSAIAQLIGQQAIQIAMLQAQIEELKKAKKE